MKSAARSFVGKALLPVGAFVLLLCGAEACAGPEGTTPTCVQDVSADEHENLENGCNKFAVCAADPDNPETCCEDIKELYAHDMCLYGYGVNVFSGGGGGGK